MTSQDPHTSTIEFQTRPNDCAAQAAAAAMRVRVHVLQQPFTTHTFDSGLFVWPSAIVLAQWIWHERHRYIGGFARGLRVLELGAGASLPGLLAARLMAMRHASDSEPSAAPGSRAVTAGCSGSRTREDMGCSMQRAASSSAASATTAATGSTASGSDEGYVLLTDRDVGPVLHNCRIAARINGLYGECELGAAQVAQGGEHRDAEVGAGAGGGAGVEADKCRGCCVMKLEWGRFPQSLVQLCRMRPPDIVFGADLFYEPPLAEPLLATVAYFMEANPRCEFLATVPERCSDASIAPLLLRFGLAAEHVPTASFAQTTEMARHLAACRAMGRGPGRVPGTQCTGTTAEHHASSCGDTAIDCGIGDRDGSSSGGSDGTSCNDGGSDGDSTEGGGNTTIDEHEFANIRLIRVRSIDYGLQRRSQTSDRAS